METVFLYGTGNPAKIAVMHKALHPLGIRLLGLKDMPTPAPIVEENGRDPLENSRLKAEAYYAAFHVPVFSCDSGLYFKGLLDEEQPGLHVRRVGNQELTDEEMIAHYAALAARHGGQIEGRYQNAVWCVLNDDLALGSMEEDLSTEPFLLCDTPHSKRDPGFPLDALSRDLETGQYYYDLHTKDVSTSAVEIGYRRFFRQVLQMMNNA